MRRIQNDAELRPLRERSGSVVFLLAVGSVCLISIPYVVNERSTRARNRELSSLYPMDRSLDQLERALLDIDGSLRDYILTGEKHRLNSLSSEVISVNMLLAMQKRFSPPIGYDADAVIAEVAAAANNWLEGFALPIGRIAKAEPASFRRELLRQFEQGELYLQSARTSLEEAREYLSRRRATFENQISLFTRWSLITAVVVGLLSIFGSVYLFVLTKRTGVLYRRAYASYKDSIGKSGRLEAQLNFTQTLLKHAPLGIAVVDVSEMLLKFGNTAFERLPFVNPTDVLDRPLTEGFIKSQAATMFLETICKTLSSGFGADLRDVEFTHPNAEPSYWNFRVVPFVEQNNTTKDLLLIWDETTKEKTAYEQARLEREQAMRKASVFHIILENMEDGVVLVDAESNVTIMNAQARVSLGVPDQLRLPQPLAVLENPIQSALNFKQWRGATLPKATKLSFTSTKQGKLIELTSTPIRGEGGDILSVVGVLHDITEFKESERQKDEFLALASHEIKTPLTVIDASAQLIAAAVKRGNFDNIECACDHMLAQLLRMKLLIAQLLDFANVQSKRLTLQRKYIDLREVVTLAVEESSVLSKVHSIRVDLPAELLPVLVDALRIQQVLSNLISNAIRYSPPNTSIEISASSVAGQVRISVSDDGVGISKDDLSKLFQRFHRGRNVGNVAGLGVGLYICANIVAAHNGKIWAESNGEGKGSRFVIELPMAEAAKLKAS